jgi:uncharacterized oxidoreductase
MQITGNTVLITGGTSGIGLAFAEKLLALGNQIIICGRREDRLKQINDKYPSIITRKCDITDNVQRTELCNWTLRNFPEMNVLINNAGIQFLADLTKPVNLDRINSEVETNLIAPIHIASLVAAHLETKPEAAIINISSGLAFAPIAIMPIYCATKAAVHSLTMSLRHQLKNTTIKVFEIIPPAVDTELGNDRRTDKSQSHGGMPVLEFIDEAVIAL